MGGRVPYTPGLVPEAQRKIRIDWRGEDVENLRNAVEHCNLKTIPASVRRVLENDSWREFWLNRQLFRFDSFRELLTSSKMDGGYGWEPEYVEALIQKSGDDDTLRLFRQAITAPVGRPKNDNASDQKKSYNVTIKSAEETSPEQPKSKRGNRKAYTLDRLHRDRPDLYERVVAKELSANAAAVKAGFRKPPSALSTLRKAWAAATPEERATFRAEIAANEA